MRERWELHVILVFLGSTDVVEWRIGFGIESGPSTPMYLYISVL